MGGDLTCRTECGWPVGVVHAQGVLDRHTSQALRSAVHECLADQPDAVVVDLSEMTTGYDGAPEPLAALARAAVAYAGVAVVLSAPPRLRVVFDELGITRQLRVYPNLAEALAQARHAAPPRRMRRRLPTGQSAGAAAHALVDAACRRWALQGVADRAATLATELVASSVMRAGSEIMLAVTLSGDHLYIAVHDLNARSPLGGREDANWLGGSGLLVVEALAAAWGFAPTSTGTVLWASVQVGRSST